VANSDFGPGVGRPVIRGFQGSRVQVLDDGIKTADVSAEGGDHTVAVSTFNAEQVEVLRGPASLLYGSGAVGGVINVKSPRFSPEFGDGPTLSGHTRYGFNGDEKLGQFSLALPMSEQFVLRADASHLENDDLDIDGFQQVGQTAGDKDTLQNSATETDTYAITGVFKGDWGYAGLGYSRWETSYGVPEVFLDEGEEEKERLEADYDRFDFRSEFVNPIPGFNTARIKLSHTDYYQAEIGSEFDDGVLEESETELEFDVEESETRIELVHVPIGLWQGVLGFQFNNRELAAEGGGHGGHGHGGFYIRDTDTKSAAVFLLEERLTDYGRWEFAARMDHVKAEPSKLDEERDLDADSGAEFTQDAVLGDRTFTPISLSAGVLVDVDDTHHVRASINRSERAPSAEQLYAFGEHAASGTAELGNPNLDKETYTNFELGFDKHTGAFRYSTTVFYNDVSDYIYLSSVDDGMGAPDTVDGGELLLVSNEQDDARFYGIEFNADWDVNIATQPFTLRLMGDYVRAKLKSGDNLPRISPARVGVGADTQVANWSFSVDYQHVFKQNDAATLESDTDGYNLLSAHAHFQPQKWRQLEFYVQGHNLLNEDGRRHQSFLKDEAPVRGRAVMLGMKFNFGE
jgi:iron complex outermembrane receptor protein